MGTMEHKILGNKSEQKIAEAISRPWYKKPEGCLVAANIVALVVNSVLIISQLQSGVGLANESKIARDVDCAKYVQANYPGYINPEFTSVIQTEYRFSDKLNTCLAYFQMKGNYDSRSVVDLYSSQNILQYYENCRETQEGSYDGRPTECLSLSDFLKKKDSLY